MNKTNTRILPVIVIAQFFCTSVWFAGNAVVTDLTNIYQIPESVLGHITSAVQSGFIAGTLFYTLFLVADRYAPSAVFMFSAFLAAFFNISIAFVPVSIGSLLPLRFFTGFFLAGIYPIGMKIASDYYEKGLGAALGFLVGALVLGKSFPHLLKQLSGTLPWKTVLIYTSLLSVAGGLLMYFFVPDGPFQKRMQQLRPGALRGMFSNPPLRRAAFGYFGHMWELYAFWAFVPLMVQTYNALHPAASLPVYTLTFLIIGAGSLSCVAGGFIALRAGTARTAFTALCISGICCLLSPLLFSLPALPFVLFLLVWGLAVIADSPLFSTLVAQNADIQIKGTVITAVTCIGFSITIISIELLNWLSSVIDNRYMFTVLAIGPLFGVLQYLRKRKTAI